MVDNKLVGEFDGRVWAKEFIDTVKQKPEIVTDEATMFAWFANAIMAGYDKANDQLRKENGELKNKVDGLRKENDEVWDSFCWITGKVAALHSELITVNEIIKRSVDDYIDVRTKAKEAQQALKGE